MRRLLALSPAAHLSLPLTFALALLAGCSSPASSTAGESTAASPASTTPARSVGTAVDSLDGLPGRRFGTALSAFPGLKRGEGGGPLLAYLYPNGAPGQLPWFAKHQGEVPGVFYKFKEDRFVSFQAVAYSPEGQAALTQEARFLFGPGRALGPRTEWNGTRAWAVLHDDFIYGQPVKVLDVSSHTLLDAPSAREQQHLREENAR